MKFVAIAFLSSLLSLSAWAMPEEQYSPEFPEEVHEIVLGSDDLEAQVINYNYNFGRVRIGNRETMSFFLRNNGRFPYLIDSIRIDGNNAFRATDNCPRVLLRRDRCQIRVAFRPNRVGQVRAALEIRLSGSEDINVRLRGQGRY